MFFHIITFKPTSRFCSSPSASIDLWCPSALLTGLFRCRPVSITNALYPTAPTTRTNSFIIHALFVFRIYPFDHIRMRLVCIAAHDIDLPFRDVDLHLDAE